MYLKALVDIPNLTGKIVTQKKKGVDNIAIFGISSNPIFRIEKDMVFPPFGKRYFQNVNEFSGLLITR
ncbi:hypothetical protein SDC9_133483 [bioreactor metagenome]|uniref:Uncharacterized protein n=1 Tax=bioreactor metagenome TaxID=1076179 RepID=A0A645DAM0_9ZZZZ